MCIQKPTTHMIELCKELGTGFTIRVIDAEQVIYKDFGNFDVEISGANTTSKTKKVTIYVWNKTNGLSIIETIPDVSQHSIGDHIKEIEYKYKNL